MNIYTWHYKSQLQHQYKMYINFILRRKKLYPISQDSYENINYVCYIKFCMRRLPRHMLTLNEITT